MTARVLLFEESAKYVDVLMLVLLHNDEYSLLPDLYEVFGEKALLKFLDIFAGCELKVPAQEQLAVLVRNVDVYIKMRDIGGDATQAALAEYYDIDGSRVRQIYREIRDLVERQLSIDVIFKTMETSAAKHGREKKKKKR